MFYLPAGFRLFHIDGLDLSEVFNSITWEQRSLKLYGRDVKVPRLTSWMGTEDYTYSGMLHKASTLPDVVASVKSEVERITGARFNSVLANCYRDGRDSVAEHADDETEIGAYPVIASVSIGSPRKFTIRHKESRELTSITLKHGDLLVMSGRSQSDYLHGIPKTSKPGGARINLTFRHIL